ncbi:MAG: hypothetical protein JO199_10180 [Candidatus Eremiobacteraeota bacterium]|nr:hypothetical protein [Candidatus Eremiobacteraeota bacterium]
MIAAAGLLLAMTVTAPPQGAAQREALIETWTHAQQRAIASMRKPKAREAAAARFAKERRALANGGTQPAPPANLSSLAKRELATRGRYQLGTAVVAAPQEPWWERALDWLYDRWNDFWKAVFGRATLSAGQSQFVGTFLIAVFAFVVIFAAVRLSMQVQFERARRAGTIVGLDDGPSAAALYARASERAAAGDYAAAAKLLFAATAAALDLRGDVRNSTSATVREMRGALRSRNAAMVPNFDAVARPFVTSAYAQRAVRRDEWEAAKSAYLAMAPERAR